MNCKQLQGLIENGLRKGNFTFERVTVEKQHDYVEVVMHYLVDKQKAIIGLSAGHRESKDSLKNFANFLVKCLIEKGLKEQI